MALSNGGMKGIDAAVFFSFGGGAVVGKKTERAVAGLKGRMGRK
jgi:hypothetical protein